MRISDWSSDVCSSDLLPSGRPDPPVLHLRQRIAPGKRPQRKQRTRPAHPCRRFSKYVGRHRHRLGPFLLPRKPAREIDQRPAPAHLPQRPFGIVRATQLGGKRDHPRAPLPPHGSACARAKEWLYVLTSWGGVSLKKKKNK